MMKKISTLSLILCSFLPATVLAALGDGSLTENKESSGDTETLAEFLGRIQSWLLGFVGALTVLFIVYGGFLYITSGGNKEQAETAKKTLTYAITGLVIVVLSGLILEILTGDILTSIFGGNSLN